MTDDTRQDDGRLSKYSNADRLAYSRSNPPAPDASEPLAHMIETAIRGDQRLAQNFREPSSEFEQPEPPEILPDKLISELHNAQDQLWTNQPAIADEPVIATDRVEIETPRQPANFLALLPERQSKWRAAIRTAATAAVQTGKISVQVWKVIHPASVTAIRTARQAASATAGFAVRNGPAFHPHNLRRRYYRLLWTIHDRTSDRRVERLLFKKPVNPGGSDRSNSGQQVPRLGLDWALSALPADLKRFAFVDFRAGLGRNLLLASRLNFEFAAGFVYDQTSYEDITLNVAQYPRSRMTCRDIRIVRGDEDGIAIPQQPVVLFFASGLPESHLDIVMSHVSASFRLHPRPMFLIFENAAANYAVPYVDIFSPAPLSVAAQMKMALLNPARTLIYQSRPGPEE